MKLLKEELLYQIEKARDSLDRSKIPLFTQVVFKNLEGQCIENATMQDEDNALRKEDVIKDFREAWEYGMDNFKEDWDLIYLTDIGGRIEPSIVEPGKTYAEIRREIRQFRGGYVPPADKERIMTHLDRMMQVSKELKDSPLERAIFEYFHLIRIQPFFNGNKRTANIVMNARLNARGYLPLCVSNEQVPEFESYLIGAIEGFRKQGSEGKEVLEPYRSPDFQQHQFFDFLGRKELSALRGAEDQMQGLNSYEIHASCMDKAQIYSLKHQLRSYFSARNLVHKETLSQDKKRIKIVGEIPFRTLRKIIDGTKYRGKIEIEPMC